jgi:hypothetical protein
MGNCGCETYLDYYNEVLNKETLGLWCINFVDNKRLNANVSTFIILIDDTGEINLQKETKIYNTKA